MLTGDAAGELDVMYPLYRIREAGWEVDVAALTTRDVQLVIHDFDPDLECGLDLILDALDARRDTASTARRHRGAREDADGAGAGAVPSLP